MNVKTDAELNRAIAELMGWTVRRTLIGLQIGYVLLAPGSEQGTAAWCEEVAWGEAPDYCNDPAASLEVQAAAIAKDLLGYVLNLSIKTKAPKYFLDWDTSVLDGYFFNASAVAPMLTATPRQMAEAAYMVLRPEPDTASAPLS